VLLAVVQNTRGTGALLLVERRFKAALLVTMADLAEWPAE
jgi:hypothetical protein